MADEEEKEKPEYYGEELEAQEEKLYGELAYKNIKKNEYEEESKIWRESSAKDRKFVQESLGKEIEFLDSNFLTYTQKAKDASVYEELLLKKPEEITEETRVDMAVLAKNLPLFNSFTTQKKSLEELIDGLVPANQNSTLEQIVSLFTPKPETYSVAIIYPKVFEKYDYREAMYSPQFWEDTQKLLASESGDISMLLDKFRFKLLEVGVADIRENLAPTQPYKINLGVLEDQMDEIQAQRKILAGKRARWKEYYNYYKQKLIDKKTILMEDGIERVAKQAADQKLKDEEEKEKLEEAQEQAKRGDRGRVIQTPTRVLTRAQSDQRARVERSAELNKGNFSVREMIQHPSIFVNKATVFVKDYFKNLFGKKEIAKEAVKKTVEKKAGETVVKAGLKGLATKLGLGAISGGVLTAVMFAKDLLTNQQLQETLKNLLSRGLIAASLVFYFLLSHPLALIMGGVGSLLLSPLIPILGPLAPIGGFTAGFALGLQIESIFGGILQGGATASATATTATATATTTVSTVGVNVGTMATGTGIASVGFWSVIVGPVLVFTTSIFTIIGLIAVTTIAVVSMGQTNKSSFEVKLTVDPIEVADFDGTNTQLLKYTYEIIFSGKDPVSINSISSKSSRNKQSGVRDFKTMTVSKDSTTYEVTVPADEDFKDSEVVTVITVKGKTEGSDEETKTAIAVTKLGHPVFDGPYGYPATGVIKSLDYDDGHCGTFLTDSESRICIDGGIDIAVNGVVKSPISGQVVFSMFDRGDISSRCNPNTIPEDQFCYPALGGVVYIKNSAGYEVALLHLAKNELRDVGSISRGDPVGQTYVGKICDSVDPTECTSSGTHLHYQIRRNGGNQVLEGNSGKCSEGFYFKEPPYLNKNIDIAGPFDCE